MKKNLWKKIPPDRRYLFLLLVFGVIFLTVTKSWHVYADPCVYGGKWVLFQVGVIDEPPVWKEADNLLADSGKNSNQKQTAPPGSDSEQDKTEGEIPEIDYAEGEIPEVDYAEGEIPEVDYAEGEIPEVDFPELPETKVPKPDKPAYWFESVGDEYFADAVFLGDSRTVGMYEYGGLKDISTFYCATGLSVHKLFDKKIVEVPGEKQKITVEEALSRKQFAKIYLMIGINEMGTGTADSFLEKYRECVAHLRELQPDAIIYLQGIMQVSQKRSEKGDAITKEGIDIRNEGIRQMADDEHIFYLDVNEAVCDSEGYLIADYSGDGVHLKAQYIDLWKNYLKNHAVVFGE